MSSAGGVLGQVLPRQSGRRHRQTPPGQGNLSRDELAARPTDEPVWTSLRLAYEALLAQPGDRERGKRAMRVLTSTASLRARNLEKHLLWAHLLEPIAARLQGDHKHLGDRSSSRPASPAST
ncbi:hypothetical protein [Arthrobacter sp. ov118]|uniref:hypothetical protein n=1 Tax=Arthrobacter sp. ov118 TaxID=1761747 RepID=UPI0015A5CBE7|nr:hypothetical protein [Arthrobacter sp. ov118]